MAIQHTQSFSATSGSGIGSSTTLDLTVGSAIATGSLIVVATARDDSAGATGGVASVTDSAGNAYTENAAFSLRSGTVETVLSYAIATSALAPGDTITVAWNTSRARRLAIVHVFSGIATVSPADQTSGATVTSNPTSSGATGSSTSPSASTPATTQADELVIGAVGSGGATFMPGAGYTAGLSTSTTAGTADRSLATEWRIVSAAGTQTVSGTLSSSVSWAAAALTFKAAGANQVLTPSTDITTAGWTATGGTGTVASCLDETSPDDADFVTSPNNPSSSVCEVRLAAGVDPGSDAGFSLSYRIKSASAASSTVVVGLYQGSTLIASETRTAVPSSFATYTMTLTSGQAAAITDFGNLRIRFTATAS